MLSITPSVQSPRAYDRANLAAAQLAARLLSKESATPDSIRGPLGQITKKQTPAESGATVTPADYGADPDTLERVGGVADNATAVDAELATAISVAGVTVAGAVGNRVNLPLGTALIAETLDLPNNVALRGKNKNGSIIKADAAFADAAMMIAANGGISMFDSLLEDLTVDAANIAGVSCIYADAWQNNSGPRRCLLYRFTEYGILYRAAGYALSGGADILVVEDTEIFGAQDAAPIAGIKVEQVSSIGNCVLHLNRCVIAGAAGFPIPRGVDIVKDSSVMNKVHFEKCTSGIYLDGVGSHVLINCAADENTTNLVELAETFAGSLVMIGCRRGGATNFLKDNRTGGYGTVSGLDMPFIVVGRNGLGLNAPNAVHAWCEFDGTDTGTNAPTRGHNVASVTRNSAGDYTVTFDRPLLVAGGHLSVMTNLNTSAGYIAADTGFGVGSASFTIRVSGTLTDASYISVGVLGFGG